MTAGVVRAAVALSLLTACSHEFVLLQRTHDSDEDPPHHDGGLDAGSLLDAQLGGDAELEDARPSTDAAQPPDGEPGANVASGFKHTCAVVEGALYCWGKNDNGQVGVAGGVDQLAPVKLLDGVFSDVCAGEAHSCALRGDGSALCWGDNRHGQLGLGDRIARVEPTPLADARPFKSLSCGGMTTCALEENGKLWCWGDNEEGELGYGDPPEGQPGSLADTAVPMTVQPAPPFAKVSVGQGHVCALSLEGQLYCWGRNTNGQLGVDTAYDQTRTPLPVVSEATFTEVAAGQSHSCAVDVNRKLWCWGKTAGGLLGVQTSQPILARPTVLEGDDFTSVSVNWLHSCALKGDGSLYCWARGDEGQLGQGDFEDQALPTQVGRDGRWQSVAAGNFHTCAFADAELYCWGANDNGQLGLGDDAKRNSPTRVTFP